MERKKKSIRELATYAKDIPKTDRKKRLKTGLGPLDKTLGGIIMGQITVVSGYSGEGKTTLMNQMMGSLLNQDKNVWVMSGEAQNNETRDDFMKQLAGPNNIEKEYDPDFDITETWVKDDAFEKINKWIGNKLVIQKEGAKNIDDILYSMEVAKLIDDVEVFCLDNLMCVETLFNSGNKLIDQIKTINKINEFVIKHNIHLFLIAHPKKPSKAEALTKYSISGASEITNIASNIITVERLFPSDPRYEKIKGELGIYCSSLITNHKSRCGALGKSCAVQFSEDNKIFYNPFTKEELNSKKQWEDEWVYDYKNKKVL